MGEAGLTPAEVLEAATWGGAVALGVAGELGTVEPGKRADLVILSANPLVEVGNLRAVEWTLKAGKLYRANELLAAASPN